jgi:hypothetical protein
MVAALIGNFNNRHTRILPADAGASASASFGGVTNSSTTASNSSKGLVGLPSTRRAERKICRPVPDAEAGQQSPAFAGLLLRAAANVRGQGENAEAMNIERPAHF